MLKKILENASSRYPFGADDFVQQVLGSAILTAPFIFTEEVWRIAANTSIYQNIILVGLAMGLGHAILYVASREGAWEQERKFMGLTLRFISLMTVPVGTIVLMMLLTAAPETFGADLAHTAKVIALVSIFAVIGAATADNLIQPSSASETAQ